MITILIALASLVVGVLLGLLLKRNQVVKALDSFNRHLANVDPDERYKLEHFYDMGTGVYNELCAKYHPDTDFIQLFWENTDTKKRHAYSFDIPVDSYSNKKVSAALFEIASKLSK